MYKYYLLHSLILHFIFIFILMIFGFKHPSSIFFKIYINLRIFIITKNVSFFPYFFIFLHRIPRCLPSFLSFLLYLISLFCLRENNFCSKLGCPSVRQRTQDLSHFHWSSTFSRRCFSRKIEWCPKKARYRIQWR